MLQWGQHNGKKGVLPRATAVEAPDHDDMPTEVYVMLHPIERSIQAAEVSLQMEGLSVTESCKELCRKLLAGEITLEQYLTYVLPVRGDNEYGV